MRTKTTPAPRQGVRATITTLAIGVIGLPLLAAQPAHAALPGENGLIAFHLSGDVWVMNPDGSNPQNLTGSDAESADLRADPPAWSADGTQIAFTGGEDRRTDVFVMNADGSEPRNLTNNDATDERPAFSPDGTQIVFQSNRPSPGTFNRNIIVMNADGTDPQALTSPDTNDMSPAWSPDGSRIAFARLVSGNNYDVFVMNADGTELENLTNDPDTFQGYPSWSPDGTQIAFARGGEVWVMDADGNNPQGLGNEQDIVQAPPAWSPDGTQIAFGDFCNIYVMDADGENLREIGPGRAPNWQPLPVAPVAADDSYSNVPRAATFTSPGSVLDNDNGDDLTAVLESDTDIGEVDLAEDGTFSYTLEDPATAEVADTFAYTACTPADVCSDPATVTLTFEEPPEAVATTVTLTAEPDEPVEGDDVTLTATVKADSDGDAEPTGTVEFFDGDKSLGTAEPASPATLTVSDLAAGEHRITAHYSGDDTFAAAASDPIILTVAEVDPGDGGTRTGDGDGSGAGDGSGTGDGSGKGDDAGSGDGTKLAFTGAAGITLLAGLGAALVLTGAAWLLMARRGRHHDTPHSGARTR